MTQELKLELQRFALQIRIGILEQLKARGFGHIGGILSVADALAVLYGSVMRVDAENSTREARDKLVCSKGHAGPAVYAVLALVLFGALDTPISLATTYTMRLFIKLAGLIFGLHVG